MNREQIKAILPVIEAFSNGASIQRRRECKDEWEDVYGMFLYADHQYRIKPKPAEGWGTISDDGDCPLMYSSEEDARRSVACRRHVFRWREAEQ